MLEELVDNIKAIANADEPIDSATPEAKLCAIIYELSGGDENKYYLIRNIINNRFKFN